jgi:PAS domain S-box-containing protein
MTRRSGKKKNSTGVLTNPIANKTESLEQAAATLKESEALFKTIVQTLPSILHLMDHRKRTYYISPNCKKIAGYPPEILKKIGNWIHPEDLAKVQRIFDQSYRKKKAGRNFEYRAVRKNGEIWIASASWEPIIAEDKSFRGFAVQTADVTAQKQTEKALLESELKYRTLVETIPAVSYLASPINPAELIFVAPQIKDLLGYSPEEWLTTPKNWSRQLHPEDRPRLIKAVQHSVKTGAPFIQEYRLLTRDGRTLWVYDQAYLLKDSSGRPLYFQGIVQDITGRKKTEERYRQVVENADEAILVIQDGWVKFCNPKSVEISGYAEKEQMGRPFIEFMDPDHRDLIMKNYARRVAGKPSPERYEITFIHKDGRPRFLLLNTRLITWDDRPASLVFATDITEKKLVQEALRESEGRYRTLFEATEEGVFIISEAGRVIDINQACRKLFGFKKTDDLDGYYASDFYVSQEHRRAFVKAMHQKGFVHTFEATYRRFNGTSFQGVVSATLQRDGKGRPLFMGIIRDMTERRQAEGALRESELKYRSLIETTDTGFVILDERGKVVDANPNYVRLTGNRRLKDILGRGVEEWTQENERAKNRTAVRDCFRRGFIRGLEINYQNPQGHTTPVEVDATVVTSTEGPRIFSLVRDITQHKATELALKTSRRQLRNLSEHLQTILEKEKKEISRRIHDDLGQQLTALKMDVFWLNQRLSPDQPALSEKIKSMTRLIDGTIHTIQKISRELRPPLLEHLGLTATLEWQLKDFENRTGIKGSLLISPKQLPLDQEDSTLIFRLIQEMLTNIIRHAEAQAVKITLKKIESQLKLTVSDNGLGITPDRINDPRSLGLIGLRERVYARGGTIQIRGIPHRGTKIAVEIPLTRRGKRHDKNISRR